MFKEFISATPEIGAGHSRFLSLVSILIAGLFLYLALRELDWIAFASSLRNARYGFLPLILVWSSFSAWVRALRWRMLLVAPGHGSVKNVFWANMAGYLANNVLPARAGELIRAIYVSRENRLPMLYSLATGLVERFIDLVALLIFGSISLIITGKFSQPLQEAFKIFSGIATLGIVGILLVLYFDARLTRVLATLPVMSSATKEKIVRLVEQFLHGAEALHHPTHSATIFLLTFLIWLIDGIGLILLAHTLHLQFTLPIAFLLLAGLGLSSAIPSTPGYIGVYQFAAVLTLAPFGFSNAAAVALALFIQVLNLIVVGFWGVIAVARFTRHRAETKT